MLRKGDPEESTVAKVRSTREQRECKLHVGIPFLDISDERDGIDERRRGSGPVFAGGVQGQATAAAAAAAVAAAILKVARRET